MTNDIDLATPEGTLSRRQVLGGEVAASGGQDGAVLAGQNRLAFTAAGKEFTFDTGAIRGVLHGGGQSKGLIPAFDVASGTAITKSLGLFSHYRLLDDTNRYGKAGWDWASTATLTGDGAVAVQWKADDRHPLDMSAEYRWASPDTLDLTTRVVGERTCGVLKLSWASYFDGFPETIVHAGDSGWLGPKTEDGVWQAFPGDGAAVTITATAAGNAHRTRLSGRFAHG